MEKMEKKLLDLYTDPKQPGSFSGLERFRKELPFKITNKPFSKWSSQQDVISLHRPVRKNFQRQRIYSPYIDYIWQIDLVVMTQYSDIIANKKYAYILTVIDCFSKMAFARPLKHKSGPETAAALQDIIKYSGRNPKYIGADKGLEFLNQDLKSVLKKYNIKIYNSNTNFKTSLKYKAPIIERFNRTLRNKMWRMFSYHNNKHWVEYLQDLIDSYNNTWHRSIKMKPIEVNNGTEEQVYENLYGHKRGEHSDSFINVKFRVGDVVRFPEYKYLFDKGYTRNYTEPLYEIVTVNLGEPPTYKLKKHNTQEYVQDTFYGIELENAPPAAKPRIVNREEAELPSAKTKRELNKLKINMTNKPVAPRSRTRNIQKWLKWH